MCEGFLTTTTTTIDGAGVAMFRGGVEGADALHRIAGFETTHAFVLTYCRTITLPSMTPTEIRIWKSSRCCVNLVPRNRGWRRREGEEGGEKRKIKSSRGKMMESALYSMLQHSATHCNTMQHTVTRGNTHKRVQGDHCNTLQHTATRCNKHKRV